MSKDRKAIIKRLDKLSKDVVRARDGNYCSHCFKFVEGSNRHCSHVIPVSAGHKLRWDDMNMKILCYHCHINWWHKNPIESGEWFKSTYPDRWEYLQEQRGMHKFSQQDLEDLETRLKNKLKGDNELRTIQRHGYSRI